jgi:hypothetical protein
MAFESLAQAIFRQEGTLNKDGTWNTGSLGYRYNNPGNLAYAGQPGAHPVTAYDPGMGRDQTYAQFDTLDHGVAATERQLALDASRGLTLAQRLATWATGNRASYLANVTEWLGVSPDTPLSALSDRGNASAPVANEWAAAAPETPDAAPVETSLSPVVVGAMAFGVAITLWLALD